MHADLHNHTPLCNHATGSMDEYVQKAMAAGIEIFGFSDHAPMKFDQKYRMSLADADRYEESVRKLAERYKGRIEILLGYEVDFLPGLLEDRILTAKVDYLIGSVHFLPRPGGDAVIGQDLWGFDNPEFIGLYEGTDIDALYADYFAAIAQMARSGHFQIVGHLDLIKVFGYRPAKDVRELAAEAIDAIAASGMAVEISAAGLRKPVKEPYPSKELLKMLYERGVPITFASDAHAPEQVGFAKDEIRQLAKSVGYTHQAIFRRKKMELIPI
jgi:histidinol-phosphatase (PHP family)